MTAPRSLDDTLVVTPTLDEIENIERFAEELFETAPGVSLLVVDDQSTDGTPERVEQMAASHPRLHLLRRSAPPSFAGSHRDGLLWGVEHGFRFLVTMDADRSHSARHVAILRAAAENADLVVGSRYLYGVSVMNWPLRRVLLSACANRYARTLSSLGLSDLTSGFCLFRAELIQALDLRTLFSSGYASLIEVKYRAWLSGARIHEVPYTFVERRSGESKLHWKRILEGVFAPLVCRVKLGRPPREIRDRKPTREALL